MALRTDSATQVQMTRKELDAVFKDIFEQSGVKITINGNTVHLSIPKKENPSVIKQVASAIFNHLGKITCLVSLGVLVYTDMATKLEIVSASVEGLKKAHAMASSFFGWKQA